MKRTIKRESAFYLGIELLRLWGTMAVVWIHYGPRRMPGVGFAVPCFVMISFFLSWNILDSLDTIRFHKRVRGLVIPFIVWGCVSYLIAIATGTSTGIESLLWQLSFGHATCTPLYYLFDVLVIMNILFMLRKCLSERLFWGVTTLMVIICLIMQYSGLNYHIFGGFPYEASYSLGRIAEFFPHAVMGCFLASMNPKGLRMVIIGVVLVGAGLLMVSPCRVSSQFGYGGFAPLAVSSGLVLMATAWTISPYHLSWLYVVSSTTAGVYYIHCIVGVVLSYFGYGSYLLVLLVSFLLVLSGLHLPGLYMLFNGRRSVLWDSSRNK